MKIIKITFAFAFLCYSYLGFNQNLEIGQLLYSYEDSCYTVETDSISTNALSTSDLYFRTNADSAWTPVGRRAKNLKKEFKSNEEALAAFKEYRRKHIWGTITSFAGGASFVPMVFLVTPAGAALITGTTGTAGLLLHKNADKQLYEAIRLTNSNTEQVNNNAEILAKQ